MRAAGLRPPQATALALRLRPASTDWPPLSVAGVAAAIRGGSAAPRDGDGRRHPVHGGFVVAPPSQSRAQARLADGGGGVRLRVVRPVAPGRDQRRGPRHRGHRRPLRAGAPCPLAPRAARRGDRGPPGDRPGRMRDVVRARRPAWPDRDPPGGRRPRPHVRGPDPRDGGRRDRRAPEHAPVRPGRRALAAPRPVPAHRDGRPHAAARAGAPTRGADRACGTAGARACAARGWAPSSRPWSRCSRARWSGSRQLAISLESRGFGAAGPRTSYRKVGFSGADKVLALAGVAAGVLGVVATLAAGPGTTPVLHVSAPLAVAVFALAAVVFVAGLVRAFLAIARA